MCACVCVYVCMRVNKIASKRCIRLSSNLVGTLKVTIGQTMLILVNIGGIIFLQEYKNEFSYITAYGAKLLKLSKSKRCIRWSVNLIYSAYFDEFRIHIFFFSYRSVKMNSYTLQPMESNCKKRASVYTLLSTKLKFDMCIVD